MRESLEDYCRRRGEEALLREWDLENNRPLTPGDLSYGSKRKVWWICEKGHRWQAAVHTRTGSGTGCPVCAGKIVQAGETDLATLCPELARQWHPTLNGDLLPTQVRPGSHKTVWWICGKGHEWQAKIKSRAVGSGCPVCANREVRARENDFAARFPQIAAQWHPTKNGSLTPDAVVPGARRKVWWICEKGHEWQATVVSRTSGGSGCPVCAGRRVVEGENDLASRFPGIAAQWHPVRNGKLSPCQVAPSSNGKVWWVCERGHEYRASVSSRTLKGSGCPYCAGKRVLRGFNDLATVEPGIARQWHPTLNGTLTPEMVTAGSHRKVWWECGQGHIWQAVVYSRTGPKKCGCPVCGGHVSPGRLARYEALQVAAAKGIKQAPSGQT